MNAKITGVGGYVPDYILNNEELSRMVDTNDEWIMSHVGIKERHILKGEGQGSSVMGAKAIEQLLQKTNTKPEEINLVICSTTTPDYLFPSCASMCAEKNGIKNAYCFDISAACCGFMVALETASNFVKSGQYKKVIVVAAEKMSSITNYEDRTTCPLFGDGAAAVLIEPDYEEGLGWQNAIFHNDGVGQPMLFMPAGGSAYPSTIETVNNKQNFLFQKGPNVYKFAVTNMAQIAVDIMEKNDLTADDVQWFIPHQANLRIIDAAASRTGIPMEKVVINIEKYGNTSSATIALCLWEWEKKLKKGDNIILASFGAGFIWGAAYLKWAY